MQKAEQLIWRSLLQTSLWTSWVLMKASACTGFYNDTSGASELMCSVCVMHYSLPATSNRHTTSTASIHCTSTGFGHNMCNFISARGYMPFFIDDASDNFETPPPKAARIPHDHHTIPHEDVEAMCFGHAAPSASPLRELARGNTVSLHPFLSTAYGFTA